MLNFVRREIKKLFDSVVISANSLCMDCSLVMNSGHFPPFLESINNRVYRLLNDAALVCVD